MLLHTYTSSENNQSYEEFAETVSPAEHILLKKLKRVVIRGKRGRGVPVLFSEDVQEHIKLLLEVRSNFVPTENLYLFGKVNLTTPIVGYKVLNKYAKDCGAKNPTAIISTRLRKHLATLIQRFNMKDNELEQLATFMGHTPGVHKNSYRLPDDIYQTAKISKILLLMEKGKAGNFKGKALDEIEVDMEEDLFQEHISDDEGPEDELNINDFSGNPIPDKVNETDDSQAKPSKKGKKRKLVPWTNQQKRIVKRFFRSHIKNKQPPKRAECEELIRENPQQLSNKNWLKIKVFIQNEYTKKKRNSDDYDSD